MSPIRRLCHVSRLALCLLGVAALAAGSAQAGTHKLNLTGKITSIGAPTPAGQNYNLRFLRNGKFVGQTVKPVICNGLAITEVICSGGPIKLQGLHKFWLSRIIWAVPTCTDARHGCPVGAKQATGDLANGPTPTNPLAKQPKQVGTITVHTTSAFGDKRNKPFKVTIRI